jgi:hypothetical protein
MIHQPINLITIRGIVIPVDWDHRDNVIAVAIFTFDEEEYLVDNDEIGAQLLSKMRLKVEARGLVIQKNGKKKISVQNYTTLDTCE